MKSKLISFIAPGAIALGLAVAFGFSASPARSETVYPWCANGGGDTASPTCSFVTWNQCEAAITGESATCFQNPEYSNEPAMRPARMHSRRNH
ncbi:MAG: DUF3551 domain-containing protein [Xanthobacteraceae bacterium]|nr:MAG: DUF3551 domain-containing protein [Xanthobacteraceae bacterium]